MTDLLIDRDLEAAHALEACLAFDRYLTWGLSLEDYAVGEMRDIVAAAQDSWEASDAPGLEGVSQALQHAGKLTALGGARGLAYLLTTTAVPDPVRLRELATLRQLRLTALHAAAAAESRDLPKAQSVLAQARDHALDSVREGVPQTGFDLGIAMFEALRDNRRSERLVHPGWELFEQAAGSLALGSLTVVGAQTNVGKTSFALEGLLRAALRNVGCGFVSCEDPTDLIAARLCGGLAGVSSKRILLGNVDAAALHRLHGAVEQLRELGGRFQVATAVGGTELDVCAAMSRMALAGCRLIAVDYIQAIDASRRQQDRRNEIRWVTARLKAHAQRLNVALILLSQFSRPEKGKENHEPTKHDLKEAGDLENAAENVVLLWRADEDDFAPIEAKLSKSKMGGVGTRWKLERDEEARLQEVRGSLQRPERRTREAHTCQGWGAL